MAEKRVRDSKVPSTGKKAIRWKNGENKIGGTYLDAGNSCDAFNYIKNQPICPAKYDRLEQLTKMEPDNQEKILEALSAYFDNRSSFSSPLFLWGSNSSLKIDLAIRSCPVNEAVFLRLKSAYISHVEKSVVHTASNQHPVLNFAKKLSRDQLNMRSYQFVSDQSYRDHLVSVLGASRLLIRSQNSDLEQSIIAYANEMKKNESCIAENLKEFAFDQQCTAPLAKSTNDLVALTSLGVSVRDIARILDGDSDRDKFFSEAFGCSTDKPVIIPMFLNCNKIDLSNYWLNSKNSNEYHAKVDPIIDEKINKGIPVGISTCTRYFKNPMAKTVLPGEKSYGCGDVKDVNYKKGEGSHAVTIIGSRCKNGQKQYLVQNSWGSGCSYYDPSYECTGKGGFWAPASVVLNNTRILNILE